MLENLKYTIRKLVRNKIYTIINILGLTIGLTITLLMHNYLYNEFTMDRFHKNSDEIYRIYKNYFSDQKLFIISNNPMAKWAKEEIPGVKDYTRFYHNGPMLVRQINDSPNHIDYKDCISIDSNFYDFFNFPILYGKIENQPTGVILTESCAKKLFHERSPLGENLIIKGRWENGYGKEYKVIAVMKNFPNNSCISTDIVILDRDKSDWDPFMMESFLRINGGTDLENIENRINDLLMERIEYITPEDTDYRLQPFRKSYFHSGDIFLSQIKRGVFGLSLMLLSILLVILLLVGCNYILIKIAQLTQDIKTFSIQKCYGAPRILVTKLLIIEITVLLVISLGLSFIFSFYFSSRFYNIILFGSSYFYNITFKEFFIFSVLILSCGGIIGLFLSQHINKKLKKAIKNTIENERKYGIRNILVSVQMIIFVVLILCSLVFIKQLNYINNKELGFNHENTLYFDFPNREHMEETKQRLLRSPCIETVTNGCCLPLIPFSTGTEPIKVHLDNNPDINCDSYLIFGDCDYLKTFQIKLLEGRSIDSESYPKDKNLFVEYSYNNINEAVANKSFVDAMKLENPLNSIVSFSNRKYKIVGITEDFHYLPINENIHPALIIHSYHRQTNFIVVRYYESKYEEVKNLINEIYEDTDLTFLGVQTYDTYEIYYPHIGIMNIAILFTLISLFIGGMGIFALSLFNASHKRKEVAIRKINGAKTSEIISLFVKELSMKVLISCIIGLPIGYYLINIWLQEYAYRINVTVWEYLFTFIVCWTIVIGISIWQTTSGARKNPVDSIKSE